MLNPAQTWVPLSGMTVSFTFSSLNLHQAMLPKEASDAASPECSVSLGKVSGPMIQQRTSKGGHIPNLSFEPHVRSFDRPHQAVVMPSADRVRCGRRTKVDSSRSSRRDA